MEVFPLNTIDWGFHDFCRNVLQIKVGEPITKEHWDAYQKHLEEKKNE